MQGVTSEKRGDRFSAGHAAHRRHAWSLWWARALGWLAVLVSLATPCRAGIAHLAMTVVVVLAIAALVLGVASVLLLRRSGMRGRVVASDSVVARPAAVLRSARYGIAGKPDYLVEERGRVAPVEPSRHGVATRRGCDVVQLAAYCLLLEEVEPRFAGYGLSPIRRPYVSHRLH